MIDLYLTDLINIIVTTYDQNGVMTETTQSNVKARIEDKNELVKNRDGKEVASNTYIIVDPDATVTYESRIQLVKQNGVDVQNNTKKYAILKLGKAHGFDNTHWRVWL